ncbi:O-antigen ligase family protein [Vagococcus zengguangii]|uniref:O-antigen ligase family protein n=1 Tax=Vagococcus zengguangii TaxID=2571750 RepID=A0A4D7CV44_9ENTE|nr:O-antigen ligase family protein [Vagococcus zengguangii]QCI87012.1 O-antigen ligase family protein [Vagococcus zengguangii]
MNYTKKNSDLLMIVFFLLIMVNEIIIGDYGKIISGNKGLLLILVMTVVMSFRKSKVRLNNNQFSMLFLILLLLTLMLISSFYSPMYSKEAIVAIAIFLIPLICEFRIQNNLSNNIEVFNNICKLFLIFGNILSIYGLTIYKFGYESIVNGSFGLSMNIGSVVLSQNVVGGSGYRIASLTANPNTLAWFLMLTSVLSTYLLNVKQIPKFLGGFSIVIQFLSLFLTQSRGALIATVLILTVYYFICSKHKMKFILSIIMLASFIGLLLLKIDIFSYDRVNVGLNTRGDIWKVLLESFSNNPFIGVGFGNTENVLLSGWGRGPHNIYISLLTEIGIIGLFVFLFIMLTSIYLLVDKIKKSNKVEYIRFYTICFSIMIGIAFHQFFEEQLMGYNLLSMFWFYLVFISIDNIGGENL